MADEKIQLAVEEGDSLLKENKSKKSKKWKKKFSRGEPSTSQKEFAENGKENFDSSQPGKAIEKEKKSLKERIRKISIRKTSKTEKKSIGQSGKAEEDDGKTEQKQYEETKIDEMNDEKIVSDKNEAESKVEVEVEEVTGQKNQHVEDEEIDDSNKITELESVKENEAVDRTNYETTGDLQENEKCFETSGEIRKFEEAERRKSRENFDAVIAELTFKDVNAKEETGADEQVLENNHESTEGKVPELDADEEDFDENMKKNGDENVPLQFERKGEAEVEVDGDNNTGEISSYPKSKEEGTQNNETTDDCKKQLIDSNDEEKDKDDVETELRNEEKNDADKLFGPAKEENLDLSQKIAKKAVGKVVGRYRQVHLTKTYCQCCSLM